MKRSVKQILDFLGGTRDARIGSAQVFPPVDVDQLATELSLAEKGGEAGRSGQPLTGADEPDSNERAIAFHMERYARKAREEYTEARSVYEGRVRRAAITGAQQVAVEAAGQNALADLKAVIINHLNRLHVLREELTEQDQEFRAFRAKNHLNRPPRLHTRKETILVFLLLAFFWLVESLLNGSFFAKGSQSGLIGGVLQAVVLSLLNVGVGFGYAWLVFPLLWDRRLHIKVAGVASFLLFITWLFLLNFTVGHIRDLYIAAEGNVPMIAVVSRLGNRPLLLDDANSLILAVLGIGLGVLAALDGAWFGDPYPGYARVGGQRQDAIDSYANGKAKCLGGLLNRRNQAIAEMAGALDRIGNAEYEVQLCIEGRSHLHETYVTYLDDLNQVYDQLVRRYREANQRARTSPAPAFFGRPIARPSFLRAVTLDPLPDFGKETRQNATAQIKLYIRLVNERVEEALPKYSTVDQLTKEEEHATA